MNESIAFVGVGRMGANMARRVKDQNYRVTAVYDVNAPSAQTLATELGAKACATLAETAAAADIIFTVVTDDAAQRKIFAASGDSLLTGATGKTFINCATISPEVHVEIEACMASSITQARNGTLFLMCGGQRSVFDHLEPLLKTLSDDGKLLRYIGAAGTAAQVKALVNMVMNINTAGLAEGLGLATALGLDPKVVMEVFSQTGANSRVIVTDGEDMINREHSCFFSASHAAKDSGIALALAQKQGLNLPLAAATKEQFDRMVATGLGELDKSGIAELTFPGRGPK